MENFISKQDYGASIHAEILDSVTRSDSAAIEVCEDRAIAEMKGYLSGRYDADKAFEARGKDRHELLLMMAIDVALYHIFCMHNPRNMSKIREERYKRAVEWLNGVQRGAISVNGLPPVAEEVRDQSSDIVFTSNPKRHTHI
jgi:phage gp36-like protein